MLFQDGIRKNLNLDYFQSYARKLLVEKTTGDFYRPRKIDVEPAFGNPKANLGPTHFLLRGKRKVKNEAGFALLAMNLRKYNAKRAKKKKIFYFLEKNFARFSFLRESREGFISQDYLLSFVPTSFKLRIFSNVDCYFYPITKIRGDICINHFTICKRWVIGFND